MRTTIVPALAALLLAGPAMAQGGTTQTPPASNSEGAPQPSNSLPAGAATMPQGAPGTGVIGTTDGGASPSGAMQGSPAAPTGSTAEQPSAAFDKTVPTPAK